MIQKGSKWILAFALLLTACFGYFWTKLDHSLLETDLKNLRSQKSLEEGSAYYSKYTDQIFQRYGTPLVFLPENIQEGREIKQRLEEQKQKEGESSLIDQITFMDDFIPKNQIEKIQVLRKIRDLISPRIFAQLKPIEQELIQNFLTPESFFPISTHDLPELIRQKLREKDGTEGRLVLVEPPIGESSRDATRLQEWVKTLRSIGDKVKPGTPLAGQLAVSSDLIQSIQKDGPKATFYSLIAVSLLVLLLFLRSPRVILVTLSTVVFGVLWLFGVMVSLDWKINFLNFIALPMMFGIGVDYAINVFDRYRAEKEKGILHALEHTGGAIFVASLTTMIGFGSLLMATNMAFFSFGRLAVTGCLTSFILAILVIPTVLYQLELSRHNRS